MNCARSDGDYQVDWEENTIKVTKPEGSQSGILLLRVSDAEGNIVKVVGIDDEADLSEYLAKGYDLRLFVWKESLSPMTLPFER